MSRSISFLDNARGNFFGGLTAGVVALPLALAFGEQTELGAIAGLYGAIALGILAAIFGGTKTQISGPTAPMTVVSAVIITDAIAYAGDFNTAMPIIIATFFLSGAIQLAMGVLGIGKYIRYMPYPVVSGFMSGIGVIIIITQIFPFLGVGAPAGGPMGTIRSVHLIPEIINLASVGVALVTIAIIYGLPRITKAIPASLVALLVVSGGAFLFLDADTVLRINSRGPIPTGLPGLQLGFVSVFSNFQHMLVIFEFAVTLAALGAIDSLLTSLVADNMTKTRHDSNRELIGQGIGNMGAALIGGLPGAGATMRTVINIKSGGTGKLSGVVAGAFLLAVLLGLGALVGEVPNAVLAGILITVGIGIIDYKGIRHLRTVPKTDAVVMISVLLLTVFVDLLVAVAAGMVLSALLFMKNIADVIDHRTVSAPLEDFSREVPWADEGDLIARQGDRVFIKHLDGPLFFGFASRFRELISQLPSLEVVILRMDRVPYMDQSGLYALEEAILELQAQDIRVILTDIEGQPRALAEKIRIIPNLVPLESCFDSFGACAAWLESYLNGDEPASGSVDAEVGRDVQTYPSRDAETRDALTTREALELLSDGNVRFVQGRLVPRPHREQIEATASGQFPFAAVLGCIDSRVPVETVFDQGIGDIFTARVAGNVVNEDLLGSLEFACRLAGSKVVLVLGHTACGAVKGAIGKAQLGHLTGLVEKIEPAIEWVGQSMSDQDPDFADLVAEAHVGLVLESIRTNSEVLATMERAGEIEMVGAMYDVGSGAVRFL
jgi:sulfate permease, SulP family